LTPSGASRRHPSAIGALALFGEPFEQIRRDAPFAFGLYHRLAAFHHRGARQIRRAFSYEFGGFLQWSSPFISRFARPRRKCFRRCLNSERAIRSIAERYGSNHF